MKIFFGQIYSAPGISFPWSIQFQQWLSQMASARVTPSSSFADRYGTDWSMMFRITAKQGIPTSEIRGPTIFRRDKSVEFTIFLPFDQIPGGAAFAEPALNLLLDGVREVLFRVGLESTELEATRSSMLEEFRLRSSLLIENTHAEP